MLKTCNFNDSSQFAFLLFLTQPFSFLQFNMTEFLGLWTGISTRKAELSQQFDRPDETIHFMEFQHCEETEGKLEGIGYSVFRSEVFSYSFIGAFDRSRTKMMLLKSSIELPAKLYTLTVSPIVPSENNNMVKSEKVFSMSGSYEHGIVGFRQHPPSLSPNLSLQQLIQPYVQKQQQQKEPLSLPSSINLNFELTTSPSSLELFLRGIWTGKQVDQFYSIFSTKSLTLEILQTWNEEQLQQLQLPAGLKIKLRHELQLLKSNPSNIKKV
jgi:hypothetical protein